MGVINDNPDVSDYFRSSANKGVDKETSRLITQKFIAILAIYSQELYALRSHLNCR